MLPAIGLLQAISPDPDRPDNEKLIYPSLAEAAESQRSFESVLLKTFQSAPDEPSALLAAQRLAEYDLIETANALQCAQTPERQRELSWQFTNASINLFGQPDPIVATYVLEQLLTELCVLQTNYNVDAALLDTLLQTYSDILSRAGAPQRYELPYDEAGADWAAARLGQFLRQQYHEPLCFFEGEADKWVDAEGISERFSLALATLRRQSDAWDQWRVMVTDDSCLSVNTEGSQIVVGAHRASVRLAELRGLFGHEVLVHALRATNGHSLSYEFACGLPGYIDAEEGFGCFVEHALSGTAPQKMSDRYLDVALALGSLDDQPLTRKELFAIVHARNTVRSQAKQATQNAENIERESWSHVNRIFRGTLGNDIVGVFTKDMVYYQGYQKIAAFITEELESETSLQDLWTLLTLGKYDPTDAAHVLELAMYAA